MTYHDPFLLDLITNPKFTLADYLFLYINLQVLR